MRDWCLPRTYLRTTPVSPDGRELPKRQQVFGPTLGRSGAATAPSWTIWLALALAALVPVVCGPAAFAQEDAVELELPAEEPAAPAAAPAADAPAGAPASTAPPEQSYLGWLYASLGLFYSVTFLAISFVFVALVVMNVLTLRRENFIPASLVETFEANVNEKRYQEAYEAAKNDDSFLGQVLSAGMAKLSAGYEPAVAAMQEVGEEENMKLEQRVGYIGLVGQISPMVGLLGTVDGMVASFNVIAHSQTTPKPSELATGISMALVTTLIGLYLAIPAVAIFTIMRNRLHRLVLEVGIVSEGLMNRFASVGKK